MKKNKLKVEVFFPFGSCTCAYTPLIEKVARVTSKFLNLVDFRMRSIKSKEAREYGLRESCVMVDGVIKLSPDVEEKELEAAILNRLQ